MSIYDALLEDMQGHPYNGYFSALCPFHPDHIPSLMVYEDGWFKCLSCGKHGNLKFLAKAVNSGRIQFLYVKPTVLPRWRKWEEKFGSIQEIVEYAHKSLLRNVQFQGFFKKRKIFQFAKQGRFGYLDGWNLFPVMDKDKNIIDVVVRAGRGKGSTHYVLRPSDEREFAYLYVPNYARVLNSQELFVVYGIIDSWALEALELPVITGTVGKSLSAELIKPFKKFQVTVIPDRYEEKEAHRLCNQLGWSGRVLRLKYPDDCKDPDDVRSKHGESYLEEMIYGSH